ncbi:MAG TPA: alpha/beta hydrolase-fold protein [Gemmataceae bacterium]|nr:alpha/beta hydrolase-fold protein [Gemmataceae bacterium]
MRSWIALLALLFLFAGSGSARATDWILRGSLTRVNRSIRGQIVDFTNNHGKDNRIWSPALCQKRDLYVYLPPDFCPTKKYPLAIFLHGAGQDEQVFLKSLVKDLDKAILDGRLPPVIVAAPDGSIKGHTSLFQIASFFANSDAGRFEDYLMIDVWDFLMANFPIHPEREAHALIGASMGGGAAFTQAIKHKDKIKIAVGFMPALNMRWVDCHGRYETPFDPECWGWRSEVNHFEVIGRPKGFIKIRFGKLTHPTIGHGPDALIKLSRYNPIEVMDTYDLKPGELDLYVAYGGKDEFNIAAQAESFLHRAKERGIPVGVGFDPNGRHDEASARRLLPDAIEWIRPLVAPYAKNASPEPRTLVGR